MGRRRSKDGHLPARMYLRSGRYYYVTTMGKWVGLSNLYPEAMRKYADLIDDHMVVITISNLIDRYMSEVAPTKAENTYKVQLRQSKYLKAAFGHMKPDQLNKRGVYKYIDERSKKAPVGANREIALLSHMFKKAIRWGVADDNPCIGVERNKEKPRERYIEDHEYLAFKAFAGDQIAAYMDFKYATGLRRCDILRIRLDQFQDDGIHLTVSKTNKRTVIDWSPNLHIAVDTVKALRTRVGSMYLFSTRNGMNYTDDGFSSIWQRKMRKALEEGVLAERFTDHDIRAKTASDTDLEHAQSLLGHASSTITNRVYRNRKAAHVVPLDQKVLEK